MFKLTAIFLLLFPTLAFGQFFSAEVRTEYFLPASQVIRKIYKNRAAQLEAEASLYVCDTLPIWANYNSFKRKGHPLDKEDRMTLEFAPISFGVKYLIKVIPCLYPYVGVGASYAKVKTEHHSEFAEKHLSRKCWGGVAKSGILYYMNSFFFMDLFADYYYTKISERSTDDFKGYSINAGGYRVGLGIGLGF